MEVDARRVEMEDGNSSVLVSSLIRLGSRSAEAEAYVRLTTDDTDRAA